MQLTQNCAAHESKAGDWVVVSMHICGGSAGNHKTDVLIIDEGKWTCFMSAAASAKHDNFVMST
jgi:hypothetical protein